MEVNILKADIRQDWKEQLYQNIQTQWQHIQEK